MEVAMILMSALVWDVDFGWQLQDDGGLEYIIQIEPGMLDVLRDGEVIVSEIHPDATGVRQFRIQVGSQQLPRDAGSYVPSLATTVEVNSIDASEPNIELVHDAVAAQPPSLSTRYADDSGFPSSGQSRFSSQDDGARAGALNVEAPSEQSVSTQVPSMVLEASVQMLGGEGDHNHHGELERTGVEQRQSQPEPTRLDNVSLGTEDDYSDSSESRVDQGLPYPQKKSHLPRQPYSNPSPAAIGYEFDESSDQPRLNPMRNPRLSEDRTGGDIDPADIEVERDSLVKWVTSISKSTATEPPHGDNHSSDDSLTSGRIGHALAVGGDTRTPRYWPFTLTMVGLFASLASNAYMGWITWSAVCRYRELARDVRVT